MRPCISIRSSVRPSVGWLVTSYFVNSKNESLYTAINPICGILSRCCGSTEIHRKTRKASNEPPKHWHLDRILFLISYFQWLDHEAINRGSPKHELNSISTSSHLTFSLFCVSFSISLGSVICVNFCFHLFLQLILIYNTMRKVD